MNTNETLEPAWSRNLRITTRLAATLALVISGYYVTRGTWPSDDISNLHMAVFYIFVIGSALLLVHGVPGTHHTPTALWASWFIYSNFIYYAPVDPLGAILTILIAIAVAYLYHWQNTGFTKNPVNRTTRDITTRVGLWLVPPAFALIILTVITALTK